MSDTRWLLAGASKDAQSITSAWEPHGRRLIDGVVIRSVKHVPKANGSLVEVYRRDWVVDTLGVEQVFQVTLNPGGLSAWHAHEHTTDRLFVTSGLVRIALFDSRSGSPTRGLVNEFRIGTLQPALVVIPPKIWHGVQNIGPHPAAVMNIVDRAYTYEDPDHWRVPADTAEIPFRWTARSIDAISDALATTATLSPS
jgi:dTDP-4-dehydrorhamnose 3,5-epimerase